MQVCLRSSGNDVGIVVQVALIMRFVIAEAAMLAVNVMTIVSGTGEANSMSWHRFM